MRNRLTLLAIVAVAALAWVAIDQGLVAGAGTTHSPRAVDSSATLPPQIDVDSSTAPAQTPEHAASPATAPTAPAIADAASADAQPSAESEPSQKSGSRLAALERRARTGDRKAARDWAEAVMECANLAYEAQFGPKPPTYVMHLRALLDLPQKALRAELMGSLTGECQLLFPEMDEKRAMLQFQTAVYEALALWAASGDPYGQLLNAQREQTWPPPLETWRAQQTLAVAHLDPGNPQTLIDLAMTFADRSRFSGEAWVLAACDLGYDCAAGGALQRRACLSMNYCFEGSYDEDLLRLLPPRQWQIVQGQRRVLLDMLQRGDLAATFDIPPPGP